MSKSISSHTRQFDNWLRVHHPRIFPDFEENEEYQEMAFDDYLNQYHYEIIEKWEAYFAAEEEADQASKLLSRIVPVLLAVPGLSIASLERIDKLLSDLGCYRGQ